MLGLGAIGPLAGKPVMEGKAVLFKKFAGVDVFDIEVNELDIDKLVDIIVALEPTFGGINLEDIKGPECFEVEEKAKARMGIPVFHDDQHGTAIIVAAAVTNALELTGKRIEEVKIVCSGAGAAALASLNLLVSLGARRENIFVCDIAGVVYKGRETLMDRWKSVYAQETSARALIEVIDDADVFLGLSAAGVLKPEHVKKMAKDPLIMALANPESRNHARARARNAARRDDLHRALRLPQPGQQRPVLPLHLPRRARRRRERDQRSDEARGGQGDRRACPRGAFGSGRARLWRRSGAVRPRFADPEPVRSAPDHAHRAGGRARGDGERRRAPADRRLGRLCREPVALRLPLRPDDEAAVRQGARAQKRVIYSEGEDERVLRATQVVIEERLAQPILIGRPDVIRERIRRYDLRMTLGKDFEVIDPESDPRYRDYVATYLKIAGRKGVTPDAARTWCAPTPPSSAHWRSIAAMPTR